MAFTGTATVTQVSDAIVRITGLSLAAGEAGAFALRGQGFSPDVDLGSARPFGILADSYVNAVDLTIVDGDLGYITAPAVSPVVEGTTHVNDATYHAAAADIGDVQAAITALPATFTFAPGPVNLSTDTTHGAAGVYTPGVYDIDGDASFTTIDLDGPGLYVFRITGQLTSGDNGAIHRLHGADPWNVWWAVEDDITLGESVSFKGTAITNADLTIGKNFNWIGRMVAVSPGASVTTQGNVSIDAGGVFVPSSPGTVIVLPASFQPAAYVYGHHSVTLPDAVECTTADAGVGTGTAAPISVVKAGLTVEDFLITLTNLSATEDSPVQEIMVRFHE